MEKMVLWDPRCLKLLQEIELFASFWGNIVNVYGPGQICVKVDSQ